MVELNKERFAEYVEKCLKYHASVRTACKKIGVTEDCIYRVLNKKEIKVDNFIKIFYWIRKTSVIFTNDTGYHVLFLDLISKEED